MRVSFSIAIPSDIARIQDTVLYVRQRLSNIQYPITLVEFDIPLVLTEALANAIIHGNGRDSSKTVRLSIRATPYLFKCVVTDMGNGFNHPEVQPILENDDDPPISGRGISLIKSLMSNVSFNPSGNQIRMMLKVKRARRS
jgi:serine/threonine-protein kinase RsbW